MPKKFYITILILLIPLAIAGFYYFHGKKTISLVSDKDSEKIEASVEASIEASNQKLSVSGWIPYWGKQKGADSLIDNISLFSEINPFAFEVNKEGKIEDKLKINNSPWPELIASAKKQKVEIIPTILWADAEAMHNVFSDEKLLDNHVKDIKTLLDKNNFSGADIDYEGKNAADKNLFSNFIQKLSETLKPEEKTLSCTIEARTQDNAPSDWNGTRAMSWANDYETLNEFCDSVKIMAYDQVFQESGEHQVFETKDETPSAPNADIQWAEKVIQYSSKYISPEKIMLGIPTYGWEFRLTKLQEGYRYTRFQSVSYPQAIEEAKKADVDPIRNDGGELSFIYKASDEDHLVTFSDAEAIKQKIDLAKKYKLKGASLFKIDGLFDPKLFDALN
jgi:spore germination protein